MTPTEIRIQIAREYVADVKEILKEGYNRALLFGSVARGEAREDSDIDILIVENPGGPCSFLPHYELHKKFSEKYPGIEISAYTVLEIPGKQHDGRSLDRWPHIRVALSEGVVIEP